MRLLRSVDGTPQCCSCNKLQPVSEEWVSLQDGRQLCLECLDTMVVDTKDAAPLYDEVCKGLAVPSHPRSGIPRWCLPACGKKDAQDVLEDC